VLSGQASSRLKILLPARVAQHPHITITIKLVYFTTFILCKKLGLWFHSRATRDCDQNPQSNSVLMPSSGLLVKAIILWIVTTSRPDASEDAEAVETIKFKFPQYSTGISQQVRFLVTIPGMRLEAREAAIVVGSTRSTAELGASLSSTRIQNPRSHKQNSVTATSQIPHN
jgi:hypothetical protein